MAQDQTKSVDQSNNRPNPIVSKPGNTVNQEDSKNTSGQQQPVIDNRVAQEHLMAKVFRVHEFV